MGTSSDGGRRVSSEISSNSGSAEYSAPGPTDSPSAQRANTPAEASQTSDTGELDYSHTPDYTTHNPTDNSGVAGHQASDQPPTSLDVDRESTPAPGSTPRLDTQEARLEEARAEVARAVQIGDARAEVARAVEIGDARAAVAEAYSTEGPAVREDVLDGPGSDPETPDEPSSPPADNTASHVDDSGAQRGAPALEARQAQGDQLGGSPIQRAELWQPQGHNDRDYQGTCALSSVSAVLNDCGVKSTENDVVLRADATGRCQNDRADPAENGGVERSEDLVSLLREQGVDARVEHPEGVEELAAWVEQGHGVIAEVSSAALWDGTGLPGTSPSLTSDFGLAADHAVVVTGTIRDRAGNLTDLVVNDTGRPDGAAVQVPYRVFADAWNTDRDHEIVATTLPTSTERMGR